MGSDRCLLSDCSTWDDGASVVAGKLGGVQNLRQNIVPRAVYVHCSNHSLDLVIVFACSLQVIKTFFGTVKNVINFINASPKRKTMLSKAIELTTDSTKRRQLVKLYETRWVEKHTSIIVFKQLHLVVIVTLEHFIENGDSETSSLASGYEKLLTDIDSAVPLIIVNRVFCITKSYAEQLQEPTCDLVKCYRSIEQASLYLSELIYNNDELDNLYNEFDKFLEVNEIDNRLSRVTYRRYETTKDYFTDIYRTFIQMTIDELGRRFSEHQKIVMTISKLIPSNIDNFQFSDVSELFNQYKDDLQTDDTCIHKAEFDTWKFTTLQMPEAKQPTCAERSFSILKLIKTDLRNRTGDERLSDLAVISIHRSIAHQLNIGNVIDEIAKSRCRLSSANDFN
ncbi:unnamed protein product [Rotaria magnacalcarata]|uniref:HAT C-terminal dimerisation domain-containing protein n=1 Tax=Rotaria magnacalcarata TaxID=392030 RepID=A0A8S2JCU3_9BILA|nr:unnamed protein product [Rotaria magnacalcarata]CAF4828461.1 unnamed protein product [Rotaria magnacalcarata]